MANQFDARIRFWADRWWAVCPDTKAQILIEDQGLCGAFWRVRWQGRIWAGTVRNESCARRVARRIVERIRKGNPLPDLSGK